MVDEGAVNQHWLSVIGRSLAYLCARSARINTKPLAEQAAFLEGLGLQRADVATMLGTTTKTITEVLSRLKSKKGKKQNAKRKRR